MEKSKKTENLINHLEGLIISGNYSPGTRLSSIRTLMRKFGISYCSALRGVNYLCDKGLLVKSPHRGVYVASGTSRNLNIYEKRIGVIIASDNARSDATPGLFMTALNQMHKLSVEYGYSLLIIPLGWQEMAGASIERLCEGCSGLVLLLEIDGIFKDFHYSNPTVGVLMHNNYKGTISIIDIDPFNIAEQAVEYFAAAGCRKVNVLTSHLPTDVNRASMFLMKWSESGGIPGDSIYMQMGDEKVEYKTADGRQTSVRFSKDDGYFFTSDSLLQYCFEEYLSTASEGLWPACKVLGVDGKRKLMPWFHKFPTIAADWKLIGKYALDECIYRITTPGSSPRRIYVPGTMAML